MNETYISLDPKEQHRFERPIRKHIANYRMKASLGEPFATSFGLPLALANGFMAYHYLAKSGFTTFPFKISKYPSYLGIIGFAFLGFHLGKSVVAGTFCDPEYWNIFTRKSTYISGKGPIDHVFTPQEKQEK